MIRKLSIGRSWGHAVFACSMVVMICCEVSRGDSRARVPTAAPVNHAGLQGHPTELTPLPPQLDPPRITFGNDSGLPDDFEVPALSAVASSSYINFESPPVKPLALSGDGTRLFAANTPNGKLLIIDLSADPMTIINEIPVGIDPVSVAVQPGTNDQIVWTANYISDNVSIVDVVSGKVEAVIEVGDEPANILFNAAGTHAFVVIQGSRPTNTYELNSLSPEPGNLVVIDTATRAIVSTTFLDCNTPRAAVYDASDDTIVVAALHAGNNTMAVGQPITLQLNEPMPADPDACEQACNCNCEYTTLPTVLQDFSATAALFASTPTLGPVYPDPHNDPLFPMPSPLVQRIVADMGRPSGWKSIIDLLSDANSQPEPAMVALINTELNLLNGFSVIAEVINDGFDTVDHDLVVLDASNPANDAGLPIVEFQSDVGSTLTAMALNTGNGMLLVATMEPRNLVRHEENLRGHIVDHQVKIVGNPGAPFVLPIQADLHAAISNFDNVTIANIPAQRNSLANPVDIVVDPARSLAFVASLGANRVGALNAANGAVLGRVEVGRGPRGLALHAPSNRLYVLNRTDMSISQIDVTSTSAMTVVDTLNLFNPEPPSVTVGRDFLYSTRVSNNFASSCAVCHIDAELDHRAWDLGDPAGDLQPASPNLIDQQTGEPLMNHPIKGAMVTQSLRGLQNHAHFHWRGDRVDIQAFNPAFDKLLGGSELPQEDIDAFAAFVDSIVYEPNPYYNRNNTLKDPTKALPGGVQYLGRCQGCHNLEKDGSLALAGIPQNGGVGENGPGLFAQLQEVTQLRGIYKKFPSDKYNGFGLIHDGREVSEANGHSLMTFLLDFFPLMTLENRENLIAFTTAFPTNVMNVVGWQVHVNGPPVNDVDGAILPVEAEINVMIAQFAKLPSHCDVIAKGMIAGDPIGLVLVATEPAPIFTSDDGNAYTASQLLALLQQDDSLTFTAVPPGSGRRMGIDEDLDCIIDGFDAQPQRPNVGDSNFDGHVNLADFFALYACSLLDGSVPPECTAFDTDCDGDIDLNDWIVFLSLYEDTQGDCNVNTVSDLMDILAGTSGDADQNGVPDECPIIEVAAVGARYISITASGVTDMALRVRSPDHPCLSMYVGADGYLVDSPVVRSPSEWGTVFATEKEITPNTPYIITAQAGPLAADHFATTWKWGDVNNANGVNLDDILGLIGAFAGNFSQVTEQGADLMGFTPNGDIDLDDILAVISAFTGALYGGPDPCD